ncbi:MAG TPA: beta-L-arabinofuranosidase domain-containing protein [Terracidiphilus sp.]|nr:beta-L-arabinofuranosidase domain-containing protein [Terracidiphilus sp.]
MTTGITRREFLAGAAAAVCAAHAQGASSAAAAPFSEFDYGAVQLTGGPLKEQYDRVHAFYLAIDNDRMLKVYRERAGLPAPGAEMGGWYDRDGFVPGHSLGQYISGLARIGRTTGDAACADKVAVLVEGFAATLGADGKIYAGPNSERLWPCYVLDKHLAGLIDACTLSGVAQARELIPRVFHAALPYIPERGRDRIGKKDPPYDETYVLPESLLLAYELTGEHSFYERAVAYLLDREFFDPLAAGQDVLPGRHAYSHAIALSSAGKARLALGDEKYLRAMQNAWELLRSTQQYATGGWGPNETFITPHRGELHASLQTTVDHFETPCGSYAAIKLARYLLCATGDARYGDGLERVLMNGVLAAREPDQAGDSPYYSTYSAQAHKVYYPKKWPCCSGTLVQGVADYVKNIYFHSADGIAVNLYAPSRVQFDWNGAAITLSQETDYPLGESATMHLLCSRPATFALYLRIPAWAVQKSKVRVNGKHVAVEMRRGFALLHRHWSSGDTITLQLPMEFRTEAIDDLHQQTAALLRGPLVYVALNPPESPLTLRRIDSLRAHDAATGAFTTALSAQVYAPFYSVRGQSYTMYMERS